MGIKIMITGLAGIPTLSDQNNSLNIEVIISLQGCGSQLQLGIRAGRDLSNLTQSRS